MYFPKTLTVGLENTGSSFEIIITKVQNTWVAWQTGGPSSFNGAGPKENTSEYKARKGRLLWNPHTFRSLEEQRETGMASGHLGR